VEINSTFYRPCNPKTAENIQRAYIFFNNHPAAKAVANAVMMRALLDVPVRSELPEKLVEIYPEMVTGPSK
jgi:uncharacterized protein YecE (DUF72 family)